jgi:23S rRNA (cytosine1962-C5)-methyltransferase
MSKPPSLLRLRVTAAAESRIRAGHPWLFADSVRELNREGVLGELAAIYDRKNSFLAIGLFDPNSPIRVRLLHAGKPQTVDRTWWQERLRAALARREGLFDAETNACRLINGESDGWPGLVLDRYDTTLVVKLYTGAWLPRLDETVALFRQTSAPERVVLRLSRNIQALAARAFARTDGQVIERNGSRKGREDREVNSAPDPLCPSRPLRETSVVVFMESGLRFEADVVKGQKTGFFLDQRENRRRVESLAAGREVLNAFSFSGGFSLYAARGGAKSVTDLDISAHASAGAKRNFALNQSNAAVASCRHETIQADAFDWLEKNRSKFDLVVLDPPSLAKRESERPGAIQAYGKLAFNGIKSLRRGGILVAASCSAHVSAPEFFEAVRGATKRSGRKLVEVATTGHPPDHPATFLEAQYLKCIYLRLDPE